MGFGARKRAEWVTLHSRPPALSPGARPGPSSAAANPATIKLQRECSRVCTRQDCLDGSPLDGVGKTPTKNTPLVLASPAVDATLAGETEAPETLEVSGDDVDLPGSPAAPVGMDIMYETEPPSEMPAKLGQSSDPIPETEAAAAGGAEPEPARRAASPPPAGGGTPEPERSGPDEPAADEPVSVPASARGARRQSTVSSVLGGIVDAVADAVAAEVVAIDEAPEDAERDAEEADDAETEARAEDAEEDEEADDSEDEADDADEVEVVEDAEEDEDVADPVAPRAEAPRALIPASAADKENVDAREKSYPASESEIGGAVPMSFLEGR